MTALLLALVLAAEPASDDPKRESPFEAIPGGLLGLGMGSMIGAGASSSIHGSRFGHAAAEISLASAALPASLLLAGTMFGENAKDGVGTFFVAASAVLLAPAFVGWGVGELFAPSIDSYGALRGAFIGGAIATVGALFLLPLSAKYLPKNVQYFVLGFASSIVGSGVSVGRQIGGGGPR